MLLVPDKTRGDLIAEIREISGQDVRACYQCGRCSAGCPAAAGMDLMPNQLLRLIQLGDRERALASRSMWLCAACNTCTARCPKSVDPARLMEALRTILTRRGAAPLQIPALPAAVLADVPQQALIAGFRKLVGY